MEGKNVKIPPECQKELMVGHRIYRSTGDFRLSEADFEKARKELRETEEVRKTSLQQLKKLLTQDEDVQFRLDDAFLLCYLRYKKFDCQKTYKQLQKLYNIRNNNPDLFHMPINFEAMVNNKIVSLMPYRDEDGCPIFIHKLGNWNPDELSMFDLLRNFCCLSDVLYMCPHMQVNGVLDIFDFGGLTARQFSTMFSPRSILLTVKVLQELYPFRMKKVLFFNCNALMYATWASIRYLFKKKITERVKFLRYDTSQIHEYINHLTGKDVYIRQTRCYILATERNNPPIEPSLSGLRGYRRPQMGVFTAMHCFLPPNGRDKICLIYNAQYGMGNS